MRSSGESLGCEQLTAALLLPPPPLQAPEQVRHTRPEAEAARSAQKEAQRTKRDLDKQLRDVREEAELDFGPEDEFYRMKGRCFTRDSGGETYHLCPFGESRQGHRSIGRWEGWVAQTEWHSKYRMMRFTGGDSLGCPQPRALDVQVDCGVEEQIVRVEELEMCKYSMLFLCPAACTDDLLQ